MKNSNNPPVLVELDSELADFVIENCETNIAFALNLLNRLSVDTRETAEKLVDMNDKFKRLRDAVLRARDA